MAVNDYLLLLGAGAVGSEALGVTNFTGLGGSGEGEDENSNGGIGGIPKIELPDFKPPSFQAPSFEAPSLDPSFSTSNPLLNPNTPALSWNQDENTGPVLDLPFDGSNTSKSQKKGPQPIPGYSASDLQSDLNNGFGSSNDPQDDSAQIPFTDITLGDGQGSNKNTGLAGEVGRDIGHAGGDGLLGIPRGLWGAGYTAGVNVGSKARDVTQSGIKATGSAIDSGVESTREDGIVSSVSDAAWLGDDLGQAVNKVTGGKDKKKDVKNNSSSSSSNNASNLLTGGSNSSGGSSKSSSSSSKSKSKKKTSKPSSSNQKSQTKAQKVLTGNVDGSKSKKKEKKVNDPFSGFY